MEFKILKTILVLPPYSKKFHKELTLISWNGREPKYDLRGWSEDHTEMTKGVTFNREEIETFLEELGGINL